MRCSCNCSRTRSQAPFSLISRLMAARPSSPIRAGRSGSSVGRIYAAGLEFVRQARSADCRPWPPNAQTPPF
jgi:hypothetical protein